MFAPRLGIYEDPATGSAAAAFAGVLHHFMPTGNGSRTVVQRNADLTSRASSRIASRSAP